jgi:hypothetical protein
MEIASGFSCGGGDLCHDLVLSRKGLPPYFGKPPAIKMSIFEVMNSCDFSNV